MTITVTECKVRYEGRKGHDVECGGRIEVCLMNMYSEFSLKVSEQREMRV